LNLSIGLEWDINHFCSPLRLKDCDSEVIVCPTYLALPSAVKLVQGSTLKVGAQNCHFEESGAFTGEVSASMLAHIGVEYVIIGHSERRQFQGETSAMCKAKINAAHKQDLKAIYCIGESLEERENGTLWDILTAQLSEALEGINAKTQNTIIAYEPVWAIGTGVTASAEQAQEVHAFIRNWAAQKISEEFAAGVRILYGGSMKPSNAEELLAMPDIDGGLIGGASLVPRDFINIHKAAK